MYENGSVASVVYFQPCNPKNQKRRKKNKNQNKRKKTEKKKKKKKKKKKRRRRKRRRRRRRRRRGEVDLCNRNSCAMCDTPHEMQHISTAIQLSN